MKHLIFHLWFEISPPLCETTSSDVIWLGSSRKWYFYYLGCHLQTRLKICPLNQMGPRSPSPAVGESPALVSDWASQRQAPSPGLGGSRVPRWPRRCRGTSWAPSGSTCRATGRWQAPRRPGHAACYIWSQENNLVHKLSELLHKNYKLKFFLEDIFNVKKIKQTQKSSLLQWNRPYTCHSVSTIIKIFTIINTFLHITFAVPRTLKNIFQERLCQFVFPWASLVKVSV